MKEETLNLLILEPDYEKKFNLSYPLWRVKFEKVLKEIEDGNIRYIHTGSDAKYFLRFFDENKRDELKISLPLRLKKIGINPLFVFIPFSALYPFSIINNFKIVFDKLLENFSGVDVLYLPFIDKLPQGISSLFKGFGIKFLFSNFDFKKEFLKFYDEDEIFIINTSSKSKIRFIPYESIYEKKDIRIFSLEEILSGIPQKAERIDKVEREFSIKKSFKKFKEFEMMLYKAHVLNLTISLFNPNLTNYYIKNKWEILYDLFKEEREDVIENEIEELKVYLNSITLDFIQEGNERIAFNVLPFAIETFEIFDDKLYTAQLEPFTFSVMSENKKEPDYSNFKIYERANFKFYDIIISFKLFGEQGEIKGGLYEEESFFKDFARTIGKINFSNREVKYEGVFIPQSKVFRLKGNAFNVKKVSITLNLGEEFEIYDPCCFNLTELSSINIFNSYIVLKSKGIYVIRVSPDANVFIKGNRISILFEEDFYFEIKKIEELNFKEIQKFIYSPLYFKGKLKNNVFPFLEVRNKNVLLHFIDLKDSEVFLWLKNMESENTKIMFKETPVEGHIYDLKTKKKLDRISLKDKWAIIPPQKGIFCAGFNFKNISLRIF